MCIRDRAHSVRRPVLLLGLLPPSPRHPLVRGAVPQLSSAVLQQQPPPPAGTPLLLPLLLIEVGDSVVLVAVVVGSFAADAFAVAL